MENLLLEGRYDKVTTELSREMVQAIIQGKKRIQTRIILFARTYWEDYKSKEVVNETASLFSMMDFEEEVVLSPIVEEEVFYLWDTSECIFRIYKIAINYLKEYYQLDTSIIIELIKANSAPMEKTLHDLPYLHSSYVEVMQPPEIESTGD